MQELLLFSSLFTGEEAEAQRGQVTCLRLHSWQNSEYGVRVQIYWVLPHGLSHDIRLPDGEARAASVGSGLSVFRMAQFLGLWHFRGHWEKHRNRTRHMDPVLPESCSACKISGCTWGIEASWARGVLRPGRLRPTWGAAPCPGVTGLRSAGFKRRLTHSYSDFRNNCSAPLISAPGVNRAGDILRNAPGT